MSYDDAELDALIDAEPLSGPQESFSLPLDEGDAGGTWMTPLHRGTSAMSGGTGDSTSTSASPNAAWLEALAAWGEDASEGVPAWPLAEGAGGGAPAEAGGGGPAATWTAPRTAAAAGGPAAAAPAEAAAAEERPLRRRRLRGKQAEAAAQEGGARHAAGPGGPAAEPVAAADAPVALPRCSVHNYNAVYEVARAAFQKRWLRKHRRPEASEAKLSRAERSACRRAFAGLHAEERLDLLEEALATQPLPAELEADVNSYMQNLQRRCKVVANAKTKDCALIRGTFVLATYMGGRFNVHDSLPRSLHVDDADGLVAALRETSAVRRLQRECVEFLTQLAKKLAVSRWAWALEVCPRTWANSGCIRCHLHTAMLRTPEFFVPASALAWGDVNPYISRSCPGKREKKAAGAAALLFYCQASKLGQIASGGTVEPFHDYHVNPEWITDLVQAKKITEHAARCMYVEAGKNVVHHLTNLDRLHAERKRMHLQERKHLVEATCAAKLVAFKPIEKVTAEFVPQFDSIRPRYKFLVLEGRSRTGKTCYAKHITGNPAEILEVNCAAGTEPDLRNLDPALHKGILFDEAMPEMVLSQRRLFQSPPCTVDLGCSATNCHKYEVFVSGVMMIVCSNTWSGHVAELEHEGDREWLSSNSVLVHVNEPLWLAPDAAC